MTATNSPLFVVAGVSGNTGSVVATTLLAAGQRVRVVVRDRAKGAAWQARGAEVAVADLADRAALATALRGAAGAYLLLPPPPWGKGGLAAYWASHVTAIAGAVGDAAPGHVVLLSSVGAQHAAGTGPIVSLHQLEGALAATGVPTTALRAAYFMDNWASMIPGAVAAGALYYGATAGLAFPQVATADIGKTAAHLLVEGPRGAGVRVVQLAGPADASLGDVAAALSAITGKAIQAVSVPTAAMIPALTGMGAAQEMAEKYAEMADALNAGLLAWTGPEIRRGTVTLQQRLRELVG